MKRLMICFALLFHATALGQEWSPPEEPDMMTILTEAHADAKAGRHEAALKKFVWFHENALEHEPAMAGVRLSFALSYWVELGESYEPAIEKLREIRLKSANAVLKDRSAQQMFQEVAAIDGYLNDVAATAELFLKLDKDHQEIAADVYDLAQPSLVATEQYATCNSYIDGANDIKEMVSKYEKDLEFAEGPDVGASYKSFLKRKFHHDATVLVALLAENEMDGVEAVAESAKAASDDEAFHAAIEDAKNGTFPKPFP